MNTKQKTEVRLTATGAPSESYFLENWYDDVRLGCYIQKYAEKYDLDTDDVHYVKLPHGIPQ